MTPTWVKPPRRIAVQDLREFIAPFGKDVSVLVAWTHESGYQFITVGADAVYADAAVRLRDLLVKGIGIELGPYDEDRRGEHPNPKPWTEAEKEALDQVLGTIARLLPGIPLDRLLQYLYDQSLKHHAPPQP
jgi:hypothetical protein